MAPSSLNTIQELTASELPQLNELVSEAFGYTAPHTFFDDFPIWESDRVKRFGIFSDITGEKKLISHVGIRFCEMKIPAGRTIPIAMIGAVATHDGFRGKGLSSRLLKEAIRISEEKNCDWTILWGSEHDFYKKFGFELAGEQYQASLSTLEHLPENKIPRVKRGWNPKIFDCLANAPLGVVLYEKDRAWVSNHETVSWFYHEEPFAFVGFERGIDLPNIVHEFGGDEMALQEVLGYVLSLDLSACVLGTKKVLTHLGFKEEDFIEEYLCLARPHSKKPELEWSDDFWVSGLSAC